MKTVKVKRRSATSAPAIADEPAEIQFEVAVRPEDDTKSAFDSSTPVTVSTIGEFRQPADKMVETARRLQERGITVHKIGDFTISASCPRKKFEEFFNTHLVEKTLPPKQLPPRDYTYMAPEGGRIEPPKAGGLDALVERVYIQHKPIFFAGERLVPPFWKDKFRLRVPVDVAQIMRASPVHRRGITGEGIRVLMPDSGFYHHPFFDEHGYNFLSVAAPDALDHTTDASGHGTGECANLFATAPGINFIGLKMNNPTLAFKTALELRPAIMTNSWGYNVDMPNTTMTNWLMPLYLAVLDAVAKGVTVCFSAGNGHFAFPGSIPEVISVGGVYVDEKLEYSATKYTSGFDSTWFPGRSTPDICGLCGELPSADYIVLPVQKGCSLDKEEGWGAFSGTSAASPMVAGVCALLKQVDPTLTPVEIKSILKYTARDITKGTNGHGRVAGPGNDGATGFGLVDAERAIETVL